MLLDGSFTFCLLCNFSEVTGFIYVLRGFDQSSVATENRELFSDCITVKCTALDFLLALYVTVLFFSSVVAVCYKTFHCVTTSGKMCIYCNLSQKQCSYFIHCPVFVSLIFY